MPKLKLPEKERPPGLYIYCNTCEKYYRNDKKVSCSCDSVVYKAKIHIPGQGNRSKTRSFSCTTFDDAMIQYRAFKKELENNSFLNIAVATIVKGNTSLMFTDCIEEFIGYLRNENVPKHKRIERGAKGISSYERSLNYFGYALVDNGINPNKLHFESMTEEMVGFFCEYIENRVGSNKTFNEYVSHVKAFATYIIEKHDLKCKNYFIDIPFQDTISDNRVVEIDEFNEVLGIMKPENSWSVEKSGKRTNYFRDWMADAFRLGLYTGGRREEVVKYKWNGIRLTKNGELSFIEINHYKINRAKGKKLREKEMVMKKVPINYDLYKLLIALGYEKFKGTDQYILAPEEKVSRKYMMKMISLAFTEYFKQIDATELKQFKHLRKTYITALFLKRGDKVKEDTAHTTMAVLHKHYISEAAVANKLHEEFMSLGSIFS